MIIKLTLFILFISSIISADVKIASIFSDHMVLQQNQNIPIWGTGTQGESVTVSFGSQSKTTTVLNNGTWRIELSPILANKVGKDLMVKGNNTITVQDVLVGEVWICSGQSNMAMGFGGIPELKELYSESRHGLLRSAIIPTMVAFEPQADANISWQKLPATSAVAFGFSYYLQKSLDIPVGIIQTAWGSSFIEGWMPLELTKKLPHFEETMKKFNKQDREKVAGLLKKEKWERSENIYLRTRPNILYNAMLHPLIPFAVKGMVWYQGEANSAKPQDYQKSLPVWVSKLRELWQKPDFKFMAVMLPGYGRGAKEDTLDHPDTKSWNRFREAQLSLLELNHSYVANTIDLGHVKNIHPKDKQPIGLRLAKLAQANIYNQDITPHGPIMKNVEFNGGHALVHFTHAKGLKTKDGQAPSSFWISGKDKTWHKAIATIQGESIKLSSSMVSKPVSVRYAYAAFPDVNLVNQDDLPAYPFRTDRW